MNQQTSEVHCGSCSASVEEPADTTAHERKPCPACGSTIRQINVYITDTLTFHESLGFKAKRQSKGKPYIEGRTGDDLHQKSGKWMQKERVIDRENDRYQEVVTDPATGKIIHQCEEPLSQHRNHGSAKQKPKPEPK